MCIKWPGERFWLTGKRKSSSSGATAPHDEANVRFPVVTRQDKSGFCALNACYNLDLDFPSSTYDTIYLKGPVNGSDRVINDIRRMKETQYEYIMRGDNEGYLLEYLLAHDGKFLVEFDVGGCLHCVSWSDGYILDSSPQFGPLKATRSNLQKLGISNVRVVYEQVVKKISNPRKRLKTK
jgi:hypothetical protein